jgi:DNA-binding NarL/FixJ family response regulator
VGARILLVVAHPVIANGIETLLRLDGDYEIRRVVSVAEATNQHDWAPQVALIDGTLLGSYTDVRLGAPAFVLSGSERDGHQLATKLDDCRGWLRKDATAAELASAIRAALDSSGASRGIGTPALVGIALACAIVLALVAYLVWLALY